jgi:co-chaperonin GroES (HSP10)
MNAAFSPTKIRELRALNDSVIVSSMNFKQMRTLSSGIILPADDGKSSGIRPRWGQVYAVGPDQKDVVIGQWICVAHGRWTRGLEIQDANGVHTIRKIDPKDILLVSDSAPSADDTISDAVSGT